MAFDYLMIMLSSSAMYLNSSIDFGARFKTLVMRTFTSPDRQNKISHRTKSFKSPMILEKSARVDFLWFHKWSRWKKQATNN